MVTWCIGLMMMQRKEGRKGGKKWNKKVNVNKGGLAANTHICVYICIYMAGNIMWQYASGSWMSWGIYC